MSPSLRLYLDPGHDLARPGCSHNGLDETAYVHDLAEYLDAYMRMGPHCVTTVSRAADEATKRYTARANEAKLWGAELVLCLHVNAMPPGGLTARGLMTFYVDGDQVSADIAQVIARCSPARLYRGSSRCFAARADDWTKHALAVMTPYHELGLPVVLVELGFATDASDADIMLNDATRPAFAAMVMAGAARAMELRP